MVVRMQEIEMTQGEKNMSLHLIADVNVTSHASNPNQHDIKVPRFFHEV